MLKKYLHINTFFLILFVVFTQTVRASVFEFGGNDRDNKKKFTLNVFNHQGAQSGFTLSSIQNINQETSHSFKWQPNTGDNNGLNSSIRVQQKDNSTYVYPYKYKPAQPLLPKFKTPFPNLQ
jgi:hypothetical protein